jgi:hypothetical protein
VVSSYMCSGAVFEKLPAIPRTPTRLRELHRRSHSNEDLSLS